MKRVYAGKTIDRDMVRSLLEKGKTDLIEDFVSKYNRPFSAYLKLGDKGRVEFEFLNKGPRTGRRTAGHVTKAGASTTKTAKAKSSKTTTANKGTSTKKTGKAKTPAKKAASKTSNNKGGAS
jgi:hypothetical protein